jgi:hypothetical protein
MSMEDLDLGSEARAPMDAYLDAVDQALCASGMDRGARRSITDDLETQILETLAARAGPRPTPADVQGVLAALDPPEAYADGERVGAVPSAERQPPLPPPPPSAKASPRRLSRTALVGAIWGCVGLLIAVPGLILLMGLHLLDRPVVVREERLLSAARSEVAVRQLEAALAMEEATPDADRETIAERYEEILRGFPETEQADQARAALRRLGREPPAESEAPRAQPAPGAGRTWWSLFIVLPLGLIVLSSGLGMTICGIAAIVQIRRSAGKIYGMPLALFDVLLYPILTLGLLAVLS